MRHFNIYLSLALAMILAGTPAVAQQTLPYNLNTYNGLPSDNVYCMLRDQYGYLWIGTDRGVVKYNGYSYKIFDAQNGLSQCDVWDLFEDKKGKIWLSRIANEIGYIRNDEYHKAILGKAARVLFYPKYIRDTGNGVMFLTTFRNTVYLCTEVGDTIQKKDLTRVSNEYTSCITPDGKIYYYGSGLLSVVKTSNGKQRMEAICNLPLHREYSLLGNYLVSTKQMGPSDSVIMVQLPSCSKRYIPLGYNDAIYNMYGNCGKYYIVTNRQVYIFDSLVNNPVARPLTRYLSRAQLDNNQVAYVIEDSLWGNCIATTKGGLFMSIDLLHFKKQTPANLSKYKHIGSTQDNTHYWWNVGQRILAILHDDYSLQHITIDSIKMIEQLSEAGDGELLMLTDQATALLNKKSLKVTPLPQKTRHYISNNHPDPFYSGSTSLAPEDRFFIPGAFRAITDKDGTLHILSKGNGYQTIQLRSDTVIHNTYIEERYKGLVYVPQFDKYIIYGDRLITIGSGHNLVHINEQMLAEAGITGIEKIVVDSVHGNIFIKDLKKIFVFHPLTYRIKEVLSRHRPEHVQILIHHDLFITGGKGGITFSKIDGPARMSAPVYYPNSKALAYSNLYDIVPSGESLLLNTDSGLLTVAMPLDEMFDTPYTSPGAQHKLVLKTREGFRNISDGDTILLTQADKSLGFDLINPTGVGKLRFWSQLAGVDSAWKELISAELQVAGLTPDKYYGLLLRAGDDTWLSKDIHLVLYRVPTFWQTTMGKALFLAFIIISGIIIILLTIYYTRKIVSAGHLKKNYLLSLELKAIHAQINPHFIFNTLNTGLFFISENRNKEAYEHISSFSELLRSYIKSARNKYIPLAEEMDNLENYIKLQQQRFEDKFSYSISADENIHTETTLIPSLLLQPFVENAIQHGLLNSDKAGHLSIKFISANQGNEIICIIDDNGVGREQSARINSENPDKPHSYGNTLIADLVKLVNTDGHLNISIKYIDKTGTETGTTVIITIKKVHHDE